MRLRKNRHFFAFLFTFLALISVKAQTLYWVGGSGNFNDPKHWSLSSGGVTANQIPNLNTTIVFDDNSAQQQFTLSLNAFHYAKSLSFLNLTRKIILEGSIGSELHLKGQLLLNSNLQVDLHSNLFFDQGLPGQYSDIDFSGHVLNSNVDFISGNWNIKGLSISDSKTVSFLSGNFKIFNAGLKAGNFISNTGNVSFTTKTALIEVKNKFFIGQNTTLNTEATGLKINQNNAADVIIHPSVNLGSAKIIGNGNNAIAVCGFTVTKQDPSCASSTDGKIFVAIDPSCAGTSIQFNGGCVAIPSTTVAAGVTYTFSNFAPCGNAYGITLLVGVVPVAVSNVNMTANPPVSMFPYSPNQPTCFGLCDGNFGVFWSSGNQPYKIVHAPPGQPTYTTNNVFAGGYTYSNVCAGLNSFTVTDFNGCFGIYTYSLGQPAVLGVNVSTSTITCNTYSNGAFAVSPTGGTANYTVNFSNSSQQFIGASGTALVTGLGVGPISATVTDSKGCSVTTGTNITQPTAFNVVSTQTNVNCNGFNTGTARVQVSGATPNYSFAWSPSSSTSSVATGLSAGPQTVTITDANSCTTTANFVITQPLAITITPTSTNVVCNASCTGVASITPSGGTGPFTYTWISVSGSTVSSNSRTGLCAGNYTVSIRDASLCPAQQIFNITQPPPVTLTTISQSITCFGANNGSAAVTNPVGGNGGPFTYVWTPGGSTSSFITNLSPNTYTAVVRDASLCPVQATFTITEPTGLVAVVNSTNLTCHSANKPCDGVITTTPSGGLPPYSYTLASSSSTIFTSPPYTGLCAGTYTIIVGDQSPCPLTSVVTLTQTGQIIPTISTSGVNCFGASTGGLTGNAGSGGTPTYTLTWATPTGTASGSILNNQPAGNYTLYVIDSKSCTAQAMATVNTAPQMTINVSTSNINCFNVCNGVLSSTVSGGTPGYNYAWTNTANVNVGSASTASNLCSGIYTLTITDLALCSRTVPASVTSPPSLTTNITTTPVNCFGDANGSATIATSGASPPHQFQFSTNPVVTNTTGIITGLTAGTYSVLITDLFSCVRTRIFSIGSPTALGASITGSNSCNVCSGATTVNPSFGNGSYTVSWASSIGGSFPSTPTLSNLCPGIYTATITDAKSCTAVRTVTLQQIINISINWSGSSILCHGASTGSAGAVASGGVPGYTYSWTPSNQTTSVIAGVPVGSYTVRVTDSSTPACSHTAVVNLVQPPAITVTATQTNVTCFGYNNGAINTAVSGGNGNPGYTYTWTPGNLNTASISSLTANVYTLLVRDANLCPITRIYTVTQSPSITITPALTNPSACNSPNGSVCVTVSGGSGGAYNYSWSPTPGNTSCLSNLGGGTYNVLVTEAATGCTNTSSSTLFNATGPTLTAVSNSVTCFGTATGAATVSATGATPSFTFNWAPSVPTSTTNSSSAASALISGTYIVTAIDGLGCATNITIPILQPSSVTINSTVTPARCNGSCDGSITINPTGGTVGTPAYILNWLPVSPPITGQGTRTVTGLCSNAYSLNLTVGNNCTTQYNFNITQPPALSITATTQSLLCNNVCTGSISANVTGGTGLITYTWLPMGSSTPTVNNLCANTGNNPTAYTLTAMDTQSCSIIQTFTIAEPAPLTSTITLLGATCSNSCNASASVSVGGGTPTYTYTWSAGVSTNSVLGGLCGGSYISTVTDINGCSLATPFTITPPAALNATLIASDPLCSGACNGSITTLISGAQGSVAFSWSPSASGQNPGGLCAIGNPIYTLEATDQNFCKVIRTVGLTDPLPLIAIVSSTNPLCNNDATGSASVSVINAVGTINYTWIPTGPPTQTLQTASGLASGAYTVLVQDANSCETNQTFTLTNPSPLTLNASVNAASCSQSNGAISINPSGGTPGNPTPYTYTWSGTSGSTFSVGNIPAGSYTVLVADGLNCQKSSVIFLSNAGGPSFIPITTTSITCHAQCVGSASIDVSGIVGTPTFQVQWYNPVLTTTNSISNLCAGTYTARIEDGNSCIVFITATIAEPPAFNIAPVSISPLCPGICNGSISVNPSGGFAPYTYTWNPSVAGSSVLTNICAGDYTLIIGYNNDACLDTAVINLPDQSSLTIVASVTNNICYDNCSGVASVSVTGGTSPYKASWSNANTGFTINNLCTDNYTVIVSDNNGCSNSAIASVSSNPQITSSASVTSPSCGMCNGTALVSASGGMGPFTYNWSNAATSPSVSNLCAGVYEVVIKDALSCLRKETVIINNSNSMTGENISLQQIPCSGVCTGAATVEAIGGTAPISYNWLNPANTTSVVNNLCPGTYFVQMSDAIGCIRVASVNINPVLTLSVSPFVQLPLCSASNGSLNLVVSGGTPGYTIVWNPPASNTTSLTGLNAGAYSYTLTESSTNSCSISNTINLSDSNGPVVDATQKNIDCFGTCTGSIGAVAAGASIPLAYLWSNGATTQTLVNLCKSVISLTVSDALGCKALNSYSITEQPALQLALPNVQNPICFGGCDGSITLLPTGGSIPYTVAWSQGNSVLNTITSLCDGTYSAIVTDALGCVMNSPSFNLKSASSITLTPTTFSSSCSSVANASITLIAAGGISEYTYAWEGPDGFKAASQNIVNVYSGNYTVNVIDDLGCAKNVTLMVVPTITVEMRVSPDPIICPETGTVELNTDGSLGTSTYKWASISAPNSVLGSGPTFTVGNLFTNATYIVSGTSSLSSGCVDNATITVNLFSRPQVDAGPDLIIPVYSTVTIGGDPTAESLSTVTWAPAQYLSDANAFNPAASNTVNVTYTVFIIDINGCVATDSMHVELYPELKITSGFSPNSDGRNDTWIIDYIDQFPDNTVEIFNRWGDVIFTSKGYNVPFDGKYKGSELPVGTYYYVIKLNHPGYPKPITGPLTIFR